MTHSRSVVPCYSPIPVLLVGLTLSVLLAGCELYSTDTRDTVLREAIVVNQERWDQSEVTNYRYSYNRLDIEGEFKADVVVTVTDGGIDSVTVQGQSVENPDRFLTIDELYDVILSAYDRDDRGSFNAAFNEDIYYPVRYRANAGESNPEEELVVLDFDPL